MAEEAAGCFYRVNLTDKITVTIKGNQDFKSIFDDFFQSKLEDIKKWSSTFFKGGKEQINVDEA